MGDVVEFKRRGGGIDSVDELLQTAKKLNLSSAVIIGILPDGNTWCDSPNGVTLERLSWFEKYLSGWLSHLVKA